MARYVLNRSGATLQLLFTSSNKNRHADAAALYDGCVQVRQMHKKVKRSIPWIPPKSKFEGNTSAIAARGFLRSQKEYDPPEDIRKIIMKIANNTVNQTKISYELDKTEKFRFLKKCEEIVDHKVPNSLLYTVKTLGDVYEFYETPVDTVVPYEALQQQELPPNLHIISNYQRFHPDTDLMFEGVTAFPRSSNLVTGLKTKKKYTGFTTLSPYHSKD